MKLKEKEKKNQYLRQKKIKNENIVFTNQLNKQILKNKKQKKKKKKNQPPLFYKKKKKKKKNTRVFDFMFRVIIVISIQTSVHW